MKSSALRIRNRCVCLVARIGSSRVRRGGRIRRLGGDRGATATEYAILVGFVAVAIVGGVLALGQGLGDWYRAMTTTLAGWL